MRSLALLCMRHLYLHDQMVETRRHTRIPLPELLMPYRLDLTRRLQGIDRLNGLISIGRLNMARTTDTITGFRLATMDDWNALVMLHANENLRLDDAADPFSMIGHLKECSPLSITASGPAGSSETMMIGLCVHLCGIPALLHLDQSLAGMLAMAVINGNDLIRVATLQYLLQNPGACRRTHL